MLRPAELRRGSRALATTTTAGKLEGRGGRPGDIYNRRCEMGDTFIERLYSLENEFVEAGKRFSGLRLDLLAEIADRPITYKGWKAFLALKGGGTSDEKLWDHFPDDRFLALFHGNVEGYAEFQKLADRAYQLLCETDPALDPHGSYYGWLGVIYEIAHNCPTRDVNYEAAFWGFDDMRKRDPSATLPTCLFADEKEDVFQPNPLQLRFNHCLFQTAAAAIQMFYAPHRTTFLCDTPPQNTSVPQRRHIRLVPWQLCAAFADTSLVDYTAEQIATSGIRDAVMNMYYLSDQRLDPHFVEGPDGSG
jgi:hypothetical protein